MGRSQAALAEIAGVLPELAGGSCANRNQRGRINRSHPLGADGRSVAVAPQLPECMSQNPAT